MALQMLIETIRVLRIITTEQDVLVTLKDLNDISSYIKADISLCDHLAMLKRDLSVCLHPNFPEHVSWLSSKQDSESSSIVGYINQTNKIQLIMAESI
ncbi:hypothetical protein BLOT_014191 [Blomia tropicalis]|nr:hypothetical protein BLOT_014191 [Blomia tropicalis]